jgi:DNA excision repair protein ERCC-6
LFVLDLEKVLKSMRKDDKEAQGICCIVTYEVLRRNRETFSHIDWTAVCLDEGQKIRNYTADVTLACKQLPAYHRIILSGTPIQNSLKELWSLFDFIYPGRLGNLQVFEAEFANPIRSGGFLNATKLQYEIGIRCAATLQRIVKPFLLRRKKSDLADIAKLPSKTEHVLFCSISEKQKEIYQIIISSSEVRNVISKRIPAFRAITTLRKLCNHPILVYQNGKILWQEKDENNLFMRNRKKERNSIYNQNSTSSSSSYQKPRGNNEEEDGETFEFENENDADNAELRELIHKAESSNGISWVDSGKLLVLSKILPIWFQEKNKVLIFSQTVSMLYLIEDMLREMRFQYLKLDGQTPIGKRNQIIKDFNDANSPYFVMLLTTRTGGVGISLTAANRVILFDPDWNPQVTIELIDIF